MNYEAQPDNQREFEFHQLQSAARRTMDVGAISLVVSLLTLLGGFMAPGSGIFLFLAAGVAFCLGLVLLVIGQLIYIRAGLEKLGWK